MNLINSLAACFSDPPSTPWLRRFLPPLNSRNLANWLQPHLPRTGPVLDPFGTLPNLPIELANLGFRLTAVSGNPVLHFLQQLAANPPAADDYRAALAALAAARKGKERLEHHIRGQYRSQCAVCGGTTEPRAFLWRRGEALPYGQIIRCPHCGAHGEQPVPPTEAERSQRLARLAPAYRARILQRVAPPGSALRQAAAQALEIYPSRALYVLATLLNRQSLLDLPHPQRRALTALLLHAFDQGTALSGYPQSRKRPRALQQPRQYREENLWQALETVLASLPAAADQPPNTEAHLHLFAGAVRHLETPNTFQAAIGVTPRPNSAFWSLSVLWAGWLWGQEAARTFSPALDKKRYTWQWHTAALHATLSQTRARLHSNAPLLLFLPEAETGLLQAVLLAADGAGFALQALALDEEEALAVGLWRPRAVPPDRVSLPEPDRLHKLQQEAVRRLNQPASRFWRQSAVLALQAGNGLCGQKDAPAQHYQRWRKQLQKLPWQDFSPAPHLPLDETVERYLVNQLQRTLLPPKITEVQRQLAPHFPGLYTPARSWVEAVLASYARLETEGWRLRPEDRAAARHADLAEMADLLEEIGQRLGYRTRREARPFRRIWWGKERVFWLGASTLVTGWVMAARPPAQHTLVLPGGRSRLLLVRRKRNPWLDDRLRGWQLLKFRHLRRLAALPQLDRARLERLLLADPPQEEETQLPLL